MVVSALLTLGLLALLLRPAESPTKVWLLAALLPVLWAVTAAIRGQEAAGRALAHFDGGVRPRTLAWRTPQGTVQSVTWALSGADAACIVRSSGRGGHYQLSSGPVNLPSDLELLGDWPTPEEARALLLQGRLACRHLDAAGEG